MGQLTSCHVVLCKKSLPTRHSEAGILRQGYQSVYLITAGNFCAYAIYKFTAEL